MEKNNLARYNLKDRVIVGRRDEKNGYPLQEVMIIGKAPKLVKVLPLADSSYWGKSAHETGLWLSTVEWYVVCKPSQLLTKKNLLKGKD